MDKKFNGDINKEEYNISELLDFLDENNTYFVVDDESGVVGNKKTGVMLDKRTGKVFSKKYSDNSDGIYTYDSDIKYDFFDYKRSVDVLNNSDNYKKNSVQERNNKINSNKNLNKQKFKLRNYLDKNLKNIDKKDIVNGAKNNNLISKEENKNVTLENFENVVLNEGKEKIEETKEKILAEDLLIDLSKQSDEEILKRINEKFNNVEEQFSEPKTNNSQIDSSNEYNFSSFEEYERESEKKNDVFEVESVNENKKDELSKFRTIMDFEDYLSSMPEDEVILKSPFEEIEDYEVPKVVVEENADDDSFSPFDGLNSFEVEEIQSYDVSSENAMEEGMLPDFNLNQGISKKVSIREVIKNKQKKKQEQKELQEKLFFETLDERIEQFKKFKEHSIDSQEILNAINMDLNRINSSIRIEFESLNKKRKFSKNSSKKTVKKDDKFSLQNLLEEIYEENGEKPSSLDINELDIEAIKKDIAKKENSKNIVN
ncbi:hypothetical protein [Candidatus Arthromitus sp. SFB-turkey]|uniref:hypothetical protein n=1 Tax=Candidatus Arthromitus sp. SFB-turkey TaxID=1840217 RepID=UPI0007F44189|nr:hypothetical protein [Candidatus Arthromitus sp. SFB-turkey]OAT89256.1 hypothetical protein A6P36_00590 [Candidatus Arthromitus sp. SFB-turkey]